MGGKFARNGSEASKKAFDGTRKHAGFPHRKQGVCITRGGLKLLIKGGKVWPRGGLAPGDDRGPDRDEGARANRLIVCPELDYGLITLP